MPTNYNTAQTEYTLPWSIRDVEGVPNALFKESTTVRSVGQAHNVVDISSSALSPSRFHVHIFVNLEGRARDMMNSIYESGAKISNEDDLGDTQIVNMR
ncbi:hypothetical protein C8J57DRAFT_1539141 [Mycena rebaudengoi]|nr:hypothetical protein C8J57DRAFT_1539141 [Mycena rebaudengoi]